jgi:hypothetical protein
MTRLEALEAVVAKLAAVAAQAVNEWSWNAGYSVTQDTMKALQAAVKAANALPAAPVQAQTQGETVEVRAAVFSNGGECWTVYGSSHDADVAVLVHAEETLYLSENKETHIAWIACAVPLPRPVIPTIHATIATEGGRE